MKIKQNGVWELPPDGIQWKQNGVWEAGIIEYVLATDDDFSGTSNGQFKYIGTDECIEIPHVIKGVPVNSYSYMFEDNVVIKGIKSTNLNVTNMSYMFYRVQATSLDLSELDTSNVTNMGSMFRNLLTTSLDLSSFDTSSVTNMSLMFRSLQTTSLDLSSFDTRSVTDMSGMFYFSQATSLDLSSFDTSKVTNTGDMFRSSQATILDLSSFDTSSMTNMVGMFRGSIATIGYARTQADADKLNMSANKPAGLTFIVKP